VLDDYFLYIKALLPEGFLQTRVVCVNAKCLRNIALQRHNHRLPEWQIFLEAVASAVESTEESECPN